MGNGQQWVDWLMIECSGPIESRNNRQNPLSHITGAKDALDKRIQYRIERRLLLGETGLDYLAERSVMGPHLSQLVDVVGLVDCR